MNVDVHLNSLSEKQENKRVQLVLPYQYGRRRVLKPFQIFTMDMYQYID